MLPRKKKENSCNVLTNDIKIFLDIKSKNWLGIEKIIKCGKIEALHNERLVDVSIFWIEVIKKTLLWMNIKNKKTFLKTCNFS